MWNSLVLSVGTAAVTVVAALLAAYPLSRYQARFNKPFMYGVLFGTCLPITAIMVPVYSLFVQLNLLDSLPGTILFMSASSLPIAIFMAKNFMDSVPISLEEAAWMDGASAMRALRSIVIPLMRPGIAVIAIYVFFQAWGNFFVPFVLLLSPSKQPAAISIYSFFGQYGAIAYGQLAAFSLIYAVPVIALYVLVSRGIGGSFALAGAVKG
jgi:multiple sugar transport system permease protein